MKTEEEKEKDYKHKFMIFCDGYLYKNFEIPPKVKGIDTYTLGVCKLEWKNDQFHVYLRRPGILIGYRGQTIQKLSEHMGCRIFVHEVILDN